MRPEGKPKMPFQPHSLPFKLRRLIDAKICSPQDIARATGVSLVTIDRILRGATPGPQTRHAIDKVLAFYARREERHLKLELAADPLEIHEHPPRGVYEDTEAFPGTNAFNVYRSDGTRIGRWEAAAGVTDEQLLAAFDGLLERKDVNRITMLPSSGEASS